MVCDRFSLTESDENNKLCFLFLEVNETSDAETDMDPTLILKTSTANQAMNTVGLPSPPQQEVAELEQNYNDLQLDRNETYISASLEISGKFVDDPPNPPVKSKSLNHLNLVTSLNYHETHARSISFNNISLNDQCISLIMPEDASSVIDYHQQQLVQHHLTSSMMNRDESNSPILIAPSLCDLEDLDNQSNFTISNNPVDDSNTNDSLDNHTMESSRLDCTPIFVNPDNTPNFGIFNLSSHRNSSPTNFSDINYQNSELSIQSQDLYAPADNDLNFILAERDNLNFSISDDDDNDNGNLAPDFNCSNDFLIHPQQSEEDGIDQLYEQVRGTDIPNSKQKPLPPPKPNIKITRHYVFQHPSTVSPVDDDDSSIIE